MTFFSFPAKKKLYSVVQVVVSCSSKLPVTLHCSLESLALGLSRLPLFHSHVVMPPALVAEGRVSDKVLDQALMDSEVGCSLSAVGGWFISHYFRSYSSICNAVILLVG